MNIRNIALSSAAIFGLVASLGATPALSHTRHPATNDERSQTDQLNAQQLAAAQGGSGGAMTPSTAPATPTGTMTPDQNAAPAPNGTMTPGNGTPDMAAPNAGAPSTPAPATTPTPTSPDNSASPTATNQDPAAPQPASGIAPKTPQ